MPFVAICSMIERIGIIGAGLMGSGIAAVFAAGEHEVVVRDTDPARLESSLTYITGILGELEAAGFAPFPGCAACAADIFLPGTSATRCLPIRARGCPRGSRA
jgi:hypothetical protein